MRAHDGPSENEAVRIEQVANERNSSAQIAASIPEHGERDFIAGSGFSGDLPRSEIGASQLPVAGRYGPSARIGFEASSGAAGAKPPPRGETDVADAPSPEMRSAQDLSVGDHSAANASANHDPHDAAAAPASP
jgi:hypothetical protein